MSIMPTNYIKPYPQEALNGELGLTAEDISKCLGVPLKKVLEKLRRGNWHSNPDWEPAPYGARTVKGYKYQSYALNFQSAKTFVARYHNKIGDGYLAYLYSCERIAEELVPELVKENTSLIDRIKAFMRPKVRRTSRGKIVTLKTAIRRKDIFGDYHTFIIEEKKRYDDLTPEELFKYRQSHRNRISEGCNRANREEMDEQISELKVLTGGKSAFLKESKIANNEMR